MSVLNIVVKPLDEQPGNAIAFRATPGACIVNCIKDAMTQANFSGSPIVVTHNSHDVLVLPRDTYEQVSQRMNEKPEVVG